jgi:hypothetical protein
MTAVLLLSKTFPPKHPKAGEPTYFAEKVSSFIDNADRKIHTLRRNYDFWEKRIGTLKSKGGVLSLRQWSGRPYHSPQEKIIDIPSEIVGVQKLTLAFHYGIPECAYYISPNNKRIYIPLYLVANNDGLSDGEFQEWFRPLVKRKEMTFIDLACIHFSLWRY